MKKRSQIDEKYKWNLEMFETEEEIEEVFKACEYLTQITPSYYGTFGNKDKFFEYHTKYLPQTLLILKFEFYLTNMLKIDCTDVKIIKLEDRFNTALAKLDQASAFVQPQLYELDDKYLNSLLLDERAKNLDVFIKDIIKNKKHKIDEKTNEVVSKLDKALNNSDSVRSTLIYSDIKYNDALDSKGEKYKVDAGTLPDLLASKDRTLRKNAATSLYAPYKQFNKTLSQLFIDFLKSKVEFLKLENYESAIQEKLESTDVPLSVFENNLKNVQKNIPLMQEIVKTRAKDTGIKDFSTFDIAMPKLKGENFSVEQAQEIVLKALAPLGNNYIEIIKRKLNDHSIDYMPSENKYTRGYCDDKYNCKTVILMNWSYKFYDVNTLAHEMGHCVNAEYYFSAQPFEKADVTIFAAEIASTTNEILLNDYMLKTCNKKDRKYYLFHFLNEARAAIFVQTMYTEFEKFNFDHIENDIPITYKELNEKYFELFKKYHGNSCIVPDYVQYQWARINHFYYPYYVYAYSTGMVAAICIANRILNDKSYAEKYIKFLKNGIARPTVEALKDIDVDLTTDRPFEEAFEFIKKRLNEYKNEIKCK